MALQAGLSRTAGCHHARSDIHPARIRVAAQLPLSCRSPSLVARRHIPQCRSRRKPTRRRPGGSARGARWRAAPRPSRCQCARPSAPSGTLEPSDARLDAHSRRPIESGTRRRRHIISSRRMTRLCDIYLDTHRTLAANLAVVTHNAPRVLWMQLTPETISEVQRLAASTCPQSPDGTVLILGDSKSPASQQEIARHTPGAIAVESVDYEAAP
ncbi:hypothetical protein BH11GEM2_BH11GEM2_34570 [soil metagenome]